MILTVWKQCIILKLWQMTKILCDIVLNQYKKDKYRAYQNMSNL